MSIHFVEADVVMMIRMSLMINAAVTKLNYDDNNEKKVDHRKLFRNC